MMLKKVDAERGEGVFRNPGDNLPIRAVVRDPATGRSWTSDVRNVGIQFPGEYAFPRKALAGEREIEAWDKFGIFRYYPNP